MNRVVEFSFELIVWIAIGSLIATLTYTSNMFITYSIDVLKVRDVASRFTRNVLNVYCLEGLKTVFNLEPGFLINITSEGIYISYRNCTENISYLLPLVNTVLIGGKSYIIYLNGEAIAFKEVL